LTLVLQSGPASPHHSAYGKIKHTGAEETKMTDLANALPHTSCLDKHILHLGGSQFMACTATLTMA